MNKFVDLFSQVSRIPLPWSSNMRFHSGTTATPKAPKAAPVWSKASRTWFFHDSLVTAFVAMVILDSQSVDPTWWFYLNQQSGLVLWLLCESWDSLLMNLLWSCTKCRDWCTRHLRCRKKARLNAFAIIGCYKATLLRSFESLTVRSLASKSDADVNLLQLSSFGMQMELMCARGNKYVGPWLQFSEGLFVFVSVDRSFCGNESSVGLCTVNLCKSHLIQMFCRQMQWLINYDMPGNLLEYLPLVRSIL